MDFYEQTDAFTFELDNLVDRYLRDFDINTYTVIGVMEAKQVELMTQGDVTFTDDTDDNDDDSLDFLSDLTDE